MSKMTPEYVVRYQEFQIEDPKSRIENCKYQIRYI